MMSSLEWYVRGLALLPGVLWFAWSDWRARRIANRDLMVWAIWGSAILLMAGQVHAPLAGAAAALLLFLPLYVLRGMAAGDVKLMLVCGMLVGWPAILMLSWWAILLQGLVALGWMMWCRQQGRSWRGARLPFAPAVACAMVVYLIG